MSSRVADHQVQELTARMQEPADRSRRSNPSSVHRSHVCWEGIGVLQQLDNAGQQDIWVFDENGRAAGSYDVYFLEIFETCPSWSAATLLRDSNLFCSMLRTFPVVSVAVVVPKGDDLVVLLPVQ